MTGRSPCGRPFNYYTVSEKPLGVCRNLRGTGDEQRNRKCKKCALSERTTDKKLVDLFHDDELNVASGSALSVRRVPIENETLV